MNKKYVYLLFLCFFCLGISPSIAQHQGCKTMEINKDFRIQEFPYIDINNPTERNNGTWSLTSGYRADGSCDQDCSTAPFNNAPPNASCSNGKYRVPVKVWIFANDNGTNQGVTVAQSDNQIGYVNDFYACQGIPIELYQVGTSPEIVNSTDLNNFDATANDGDDEFARANHYQQNVMNVYIPANLNGPGCNGYAYLPTGSSGVDAVMMDGSCYTNVTDVCNSTGFAVVFIHEVGHYLGLYHTHGSYSEGSGGSGFFGTVSTELVNGSNGCSTGDYVHDTPADLGISHALRPFNPVDNPVGGCATRSGCNITFSCTDANGQIYDVDDDNIMNYNNSGSCRNDFTDCQKARMVDALVCARNYLCDDNVERFFASNTVNNTNAPYKEICIGESAPSFNTIDACFNWYASATGGAPLASNTGSFTPTIGTGLGQLDNNTPGTYTFYVQEVNSYNPDCRQAVTILVAPNPGDATAAAECVNTSATLALDASGTALGTDQLVGWWVTGGNPIATTATNQASLDAQLAAVTVGGTVSGPSPNVVFEATNNAAFNLPIDCSNLTSGVDYYATPFVSTVKAAVPDVNLTHTTGSFVTGTFNGNSAARYTSGNIPGIPANPINDPTYTVTVTVNSVSPNRNVSFFFKNDGIACGGPGQVINGGGSTGVYTFTETELSGYDPANGFCFWLFSFEGGITVNYTVNIAITYPGAAAITFPSVDYNDCVFGTPVLIQCTPDCNFLPVELTSFTGKKLDTQVQLDWTTATEINHDYFSVERSTTGRDFYPFDRVLGNGDSSTPKAYTSLDRNPSQGINYYRLVQYDLDGRATNSRTIAIDFKADASVKIIPNPVTANNFTINYFSEKEGPVLLALFDVTGRLLQTRNWSVTNGDNNLEMNIGHYEPGVYLLRSTQAGQTLVSRLVKK